MTLMEKRCLGGAILVTLCLQLLITGFFSFGETVPLTVDTHLGNFQQTQFHFPPQGDFNTDYWLGTPQLPNGLHPLSLFSHLPFWLFVTTFYPLCATTSLYFTFILFRAWGFRPFSAIFAGVLFAWQGSFLSNLLPAHFSPAALFAFFPLTFYWVTCAHQKNSLLYWSWAGFGSGMMMLFLPDQGFLANLLIGSYLLFIFSIHFSRDSKVNASSPALSIRRFVLGIFLWGGITFLIALPGIESVVLQNIKGVQQGATESSEKKYEWATQWSFPPEEIIQYIVPGFLGWHNLSQEGPYWGRIGQSKDWNSKDQGMRNYMLGINTLGTVAALLAGIGFFCLIRKEDSHTSIDSSLHLRPLLLYFIFTGIIFFLLGLGKYGPLYQFFYKIPGMDSWRNPLKFILLPGNFCLIVLSTFGAEQLYKTFQIKYSSPENLEKMKGLAFILSLSLLSLIPFYLLLTILLPAILPIFHYSPSESGHILGTVLGSILITLLMTCFWFLLIALLEKNNRVRHFPILNRWISILRDWAFQERNLESTWFVGLIFLVIVQMLWVQQHYLLARPLKNLTDSSDLIRKIKQDSTPVRVKFMTRDALLDDHLNIRFPLHGIASIDIPAASRIPHDYQLFFEKISPYPLRFAELCAVQYLIGTTSAWAEYSQDPAIKPGLGKTFFFGPGDSEMNLLKELSDPNGSLYTLTTLKNALPRISIIPQSESLSSEELLFKRLQDPLWDPKKSVLFQGTSVSITSPVFPAFTPTLSIHQYNSQLIEVTTELPSPAFLLIADRYDPDWKAEVNGKEIPIERANFIQRAIPLPAGKSMVKIKYSPRVFPLYIQLLTLLSLTLVSIRVTRFAHTCASTPHN